MALSTGLMIQLLLASFVILVVNASKWIPAYAGPWRNTIRRYTSCEPQEGGKALYRFSHPKGNGEQVVTGNTTTTKDFDDTISAVITMDLWNNNQWKQKAFVFPFPDRACSNLRVHIPYFFNRFLHQKIDLQAPCVVPKGVYAVDNLPVNLTFPKVPVMPYGRYRFLVQYADLQKVPFLCMDFEVEIIPKT